MKIAVFVDYWNLQLTLNEVLTKKLSVADYRAQIDWRTLGPTLMTAACGVLGIPDNTASYEGIHIYTSYNPATAEGAKFKKWATTWLDRQPGVNLQIRERRPKAHQKCPTCHQHITHCPHQACGQPIVATVEKGIDTLLVTDLVRLACSGAYDVAVLASSDADMVPAVTFIQSQGRKVIQAGFPPLGVHLATECWASFDITAIPGGVERT